MRLKAGQFYGHRSQELASDDFLFVERTYLPNGKIPKHAHERAHLCFVLSGGYLESIGERIYERNPATLVYYPEDTTHGEEHFIDGRHFLVEIAPVVLERMRGYGARLDEPASVATDSTLWLASRMYREFTARDAFAPLVLESMASELLVATIRTLTPTLERNAPRWLVSAREYLAQNFVEPPGLRELAQAVSVHPSHLARVFRRFESCTPGEYIRRLRVSRSRALLADGRTPMVEIAHEVGFSDQSHFTRSFRIETGMTPRQYRDMFTRH